MKWSRAGIIYVYIQVPIYIYIKIPNTDPTSAHPCSPFISAREPHKRGREPSIESLAGPQCRSRSVTEHGVEREGDRARRRVTKRGEER
jgi:hypothetical protein